MENKYRKGHILDKVKEAVEELKLVKAGKKKAHNAEDFLTELKRIGTCSGTKEKSSTALPKIQFPK